MARIDKDVSFAYERADSGDSGVIAGSTASEFYIVKDGKEINISDFVELPTDDIDSPNIEDLSANFDRIKYIKYYDRDVWTVEKDCSDIFSNNFSLESGKTVSAGIEPGTRPTFKHTYTLDSESACLAGGTWYTITSEYETNDNTTTLHIYEGQVKQSDYTNSTDVANLSIKGKLTRAIVTLQAAGGSGGGVGGGIYNASGGGGGGGFAAAIIDLTKDWVLFLGNPGVSENFNSGNAGRKSELKRWDGSKIMTGHSEIICNGGEGGGAGKSFWYIAEGGAGGTASISINSASNEMWYIPNSSSSTITGGNGGKGGYGKNGQSTDGASVSKFRLYNTNRSNDQHGNGTQYYSAKTGGSRGNGQVNGGGGGGASASWNGQDGDPSGQAGVGAGGGGVAEGKTYFSGAGGIARFTISY